MSEAEQREDARKSSYRPALAKLSIDLDTTRNQLRTGFSGEAEYLEWLQRVTVNTLGEIPMQFLTGAARQLRRNLMPDVQPTVYNGLMGPAETKAEEEIRLHIWGEFVEPAYYRGFRRLRKSVTEYVDTDDPSDQGKHHPARQRYVAMRPAINELDQYQKRGLARIGAAYQELDVEPLQGPDDIPEWGSELRLATHGELSPNFVKRCSGEPGTRDLLLNGSQELRALFAATYLLPVYNAGVRDLSGRAGETPTAEEREGLSGVDL